MSDPFNSEQSAAMYLLREATEILNECGVDFIVMGGWVPFLFHTQRYPHPGTFEVDILVHSDSLDDGSFDSAGEALLTRGYLRAVKNRFQAHRVLCVVNEDLVFHVDFLNERAPNNELELVIGTGKMHSIYTPTMKAVFKYNEFRTHPNFEGIRFPSVETFIVSKAAAALVKKRTRDAFDIFVSAADQPPEFHTQWETLVYGDGLFRDANDSLWETIHNKDGVEKIFSILNELGLPTLPSQDAVIDAFSFLRAPTVS